MNKTIIAAVLAACLLVAGCGWVERVTATATGWSRICIAGVSYLQFTSGATVEYGTDGKIKLCK